MKTQVRSRSFWSLAWYRYRQDRLALVGLAVVLFIFFVTLLAPLIASDKPVLLKREGTWSSPLFSSLFLPRSKESATAERINYRTISLNEGDLRIMPPIPYTPNEYDLHAVLRAPDSEHWLGTDDQGRDVASRLVHGCRISISVGFVAVGIYVAIGILIGGLAGYFGGWLDIVISRLIEVVICFPVFFLVLTVLAFIGPSIYNIMIVIGVTSWTGIARLVRGEFLKQRPQDYVHAARVLGARPWRIMFRHIFPNSMAPVLVSSTFGIAGAILVESSLSFLGFGVQPPTPSWGDLLSQSRNYIDIAWWLTFFPGLAIFVTITAFNLIGEGLRDALDPRLRSVKLE